MNKTYMNRLPYIQPEGYLEEDYGLYDLICDSPVEGGLEGTGEEDWTL